MTTRLYFEGPSDLSVGTIRIDGMGKSVADWVATPDNRTFYTGNIAPGLYATEIVPAGVTPQAVIFEVRADVDNRVVLPPFSTLAASGSNTSFYDTGKQLTHARVPGSIDLAFLALPDGPVTSEVAPGKDAAPPIVSRSLPLSSKKSRIAVGLSQEGGGRDSFTTFRGAVRMEVLAGQIELELPDDPGRDIWDGGRVRLSTAIEDVRIERCLLPLYRGGTRIMLATPPFAASDLELRVVPVDPHTRALLRALDAGSQDERQAVREHIVPTLFDRVLGEQGDPWAALLIGLLAARFPGEFASVSPAWTALLTQRIDWAFDAHVIHAGGLLAAANDQDIDARNAAVAAAVTLFARAQTAGSPYFRYTNQLLADMAADIANHIEQHAPGIDPATLRQFEKVHRRWYRELPLQRGAGPTFTWLARDLHILKERQLLLPNRHPSGRLAARSTAILMEGELRAGRITLLRGQTPADQPAQTGLPTQWYAMRNRPFGHGEVRGAPSLPWSSQNAADPNKGQFGGASHANGFTLSATFAPAAADDWADIVLTVQADDPGASGLEDIAWFALHPTFSPATVKVALRGGRAQLSIQAWGGFTVGVSIARPDPQSEVRLECDLATLPDAPAIIRTR